MLLIWGPPETPKRSAPVQFSTLWGRPGRIWGRPCELLRASWPPRRPRCPQEPERRLPEASQTPPEASQSTPETSKIPKKLFQNLSVYFLLTFCAIPLSLAMLQLRPGGMRATIKSGHPRAAWAPVSNVKNESFSSNIKLQGPRAFCRAPWRTREGHVEDT